MTKPKSIILTALFTALMAAGAYVKIPAPIVPFTLQVFFCVLSGLLLGGKRAAAAQVLYVALGLAGLPVFTGGGGIGYVFMPTFGYVAGFIFLAAITGFLANKFCPKRDSVIKLTLLSLIALVVFYVVGVEWLRLQTTAMAKAAPDTFSVIYTGALVFLPWDAVKIIACAVVARRVWRFM